MKPVALRLRAFGPYPEDESVDFEALAPRGLFLVSGDTGAGKTTIFDAMCWALYGAMPGRDPGEVRSHHVGPETSTEVIFTFDADGDRYTVTRSPRWDRPIKRGTGTTVEPARATLVRHTAGGGTHPVATGVTDVTARCTEIVGLKAEQFQRVVLLPQGEFARFLLADTKDREPLLSQLFGGDRYDRMVEWLKEHRDQLQQELRNVDQAVAAKLDAARDHLDRCAQALGVELPAEAADADRSRLGEWSARLEEPLRALTCEVDELTATARVHAAARVAAQEHANRYDRAVQLRHQLDDLQRRQPQVDADAEAAQRSAAARPVVQAADELEDARAAAGEARADAERLRDEIRARFAAIGLTVDPTSATNALALLAEHREHIRGQRVALDAVQAARGALEQAEQERDQATQRAQALGSELEQVKARLAEIDARLPDLRALAATLDRLEDRLRALDTALAHRRTLAATEEQWRAAAAESTRAVAHYEQVLAAYVRSEAPRLAAGLRGGEPCPVCGSHEHPAPAAATDGELTDFTAVQQAGTERDRALAAVKDLEAEVRELRGALGDDADRPVEDLQQRRDDLADERQRAVEASRAANELDAERTGLADRVTELERDRATLAERAHQAEAALAEARAALTRAEEAAAGIDPAEVNRHADELDHLEPLCAGLEASTATVVTADEVLTRAERALQERVADSPFSSAGDARAALLDPDEEGGRLAAKRNHDQARAEATGQLRELEEQGLPVARPDVEAATRLADEIEAARTKRAATLQTAADAFGYLTEALEEHDAIVDASGLRRAALATAERTYTVCQSGGAGTAMSLTRWVLTRELDRVAAAANVHLRRMTGERYTLRRREERTDQRRAFGLDLEVLDAQTGRPRSTSSLSGGEQFQASLALALGLADVVSHGVAGSGRRFEALFVDEGFGSLSAEALDDAVETLAMLQTTGRLVGAITHVEAMKQQVHVGIEVTRRPDGAGSTLVVHP
jgi:exonuclease SbcC